VLAGAGKETAMKFRIALFAFVLIVPGGPLLAEESATPDGVPHAVAAAALRMAALRQRSRT
jgi:hypothetical protein